jgi:glutamine synthetase type III
MKGLSAGDLDNNWIINNNIIEKVAAAILDWACDRGAKYYGHWCHPLGGNGLRYGGSAIVYRSLVTHNSRNTPTLGFSGNNLIRDEAEVSFFPTGKIHFICEHLLLLGHFGTIMLRWFTYSS